MDNRLREKNMTTQENKLKSELFYLLYLDCLKFKTNEMTAKDIDCNQFLLQEGYYNVIIEKLKK
jgi:hypothetical protein